MDRPDQVRTRPNDQSFGDRRLRWREAPEGLIFGLGQDPKNPPPPPRAPKSLKSPVRAGLALSMACMTSHI